MALVVATVSAGAAPAGSVARPDVPARAAAPPAVLSVTPSTGLVDGQSVTITPPAVTAPSASDGVDYVICPPGVPTYSGCAYLYPSSVGPTAVVVSVPARILSGNGTDTITSTDCRTSDCEIRAVIFSGIEEVDSSDPADDTTPDSSFTIVAKAPVHFDSTAPLRTPPSLVVSPTSDLTDGASVDVSVTSGTAVVDPSGPGTFVAQCTSPITSVSQLADIYDSCSLDEPIDLAPSPGGVWKGSVEVSTYIETSHGPVDCRAPGATCAIVALDMVGQSDNVSLAFDPDGAVRPRILQRPMNDLGENFAMVMDIIGLTPNDPYTVKWCNDQQQCLSRVIASGTLDDHGVATFTFDDTGFPDVADDDTTCVDECTLTALDAHGLIALSGFGFGIGSVPPEGPFTSARHPVTITPHKGLHDNDTVTVTASGFRPGADIAIVECTGTALSEGASACDIDTSTVIAGQQVTADAAGNVSATYTVRRNIRTGDGAFDCRNGNVDPDAYAAGVAVDPTRDAALRGGGYSSCIIAVADLSDYSESGGMPIAFAGATFKPLPWEHPSTAGHTAPVATPVSARPSFTG